MFYLLASILFCNCCWGTILDPTTIVISFDGFRWDYLSFAPTPNINRLIEGGVFVPRLRPAFQSKTFPNYYSIATGLYAESHGIVSNSMYDPITGETFRIGDPDAVTSSHWWGGEPFWVTAEKAGQKAGIYFWPGSEAKIQGHRPTYYEVYSDNAPYEPRIDQILKWIDLPEEERPTSLAVYFHQPDSAGHSFGPTSPQVREQIIRVDALLGRLLSGLAQRGVLDEVNIILVSDHGMSEERNAIYLADYIDLSQVQVVDRSPNPQLIPAEGMEDEIMRNLTNSHPNIRWYRKNEIPSRLGFSDNVRITPIVGIADIGFVVYDSFGTPSGGGHGWDNLNDDMQTIFVGSGPMFQSGAILPEMTNLDIYEIVCASLRLTPAPNNGTLDNIKPYLNYSW